MRIELSFTDYTNKAAGVPVLYPDVVKLERRFHWLHVFEYPNNTSSIHDIAQIADIRMVVVDAD